MLVTSFEIKVNHMPEMEQALKQGTAVALEKWGILAQGYATEYAPVDTGNLRSSIDYDTDVNEKVMVVGTNVEYAPYQEFGTYKMAAHPYLRPALENHLSEYEDILASTLASYMG